MLESPGAEERVQKLVESAKRAAAQKKPGLTRAELHKRHTVEMPEVIE